MDANGQIYNEALGLNIGFVENELRFYKPDTGTALLSPLETTLALEAAERRLETECELRLQSKREMERLRAELAALRQTCLTEEGE